MACREGHRVRALASMVLLWVAGCTRDSEVDRPQTTSQPPDQQAVETTAPDEAEGEVTAGSPLPNPFLTPEEQQVLASGAVRTRLDSLRVTAIIYAPPLSQAIVDGRMVREGDVIDRKEVIEIQPEAVVLRELGNSQQEYLVELEVVAGSRPPPPSQTGFVQPR